MRSKTGDINASIGQQTRRIAAVERVITDNKFVSLEKEVVDSEKKHSWAIQFIEERLIR